MCRPFALVALLCLPITQAADPPQPDPEQPVDYVKWLNQAYSRAIAQNAARTYRKAFAAYHPNQRLENLAVATDAKSWNTKRRSRFAQWVHANAECLEAFAAATRQPGCYFAGRSDLGVLFDLTVLETAAVRSLARLTAARARLRLLEGDLDGACQDVATLLGACNHMQQQPMFVQYAIGMEIGAQAYDILLDVPRLAPGAVDYQHALSELKAVDTAPGPPLRQIEFEKLMLWDIAQRYLRDTDGDGRFDTVATPPELGMAGKHLSLDWPRPFDAFVAEITEHSDLWRDALVPNYQKAREAGEAVAKRLKPASPDVFKILRARVWPIAQLQRRLIASRKGYRVVFHLLSYHACHGHWPADLKQALPDDAADLATDPFADKPFVYRLKDDQPLLYSVSENGLDDGGEPFLLIDRPTWGKTGDYVFWPRGADSVTTAPAGPTTRAAGANAPLPHAHDLP